MLMSFVMMTWLLFAVHIGSAGKKATISIFEYTTPAIVMWAVIFLAGAGIATQSSLRATKGLHGSMMFTVSLPVSRLRLVAVRAAIGWLEAACLIGLLCACLWHFSAVLKEIATPMEMLEQAGVLFVCSSVIYFLSVALATFLEEQWRIWITMIAMLAFFLTSVKFSLPAQVDLLKAMGRGSPLVVHTVPWGAMTFAAGLSVVLFGVAVTIARMREY
jgi:hypothetical protein